MTSWTRRHSRGRWAAALAALVAACGDDAPDPEEAPPVFTARARPAETGATPEAPVGPQAGDVQRRALLELATLNACLRARDASAAERTRLLGERFTSLGLTLATYAEAMERMTRDATFQAEVVAGTAACPAVTTETATAGAGTPSTTAGGTLAATQSGTWTGAIRGELTGAVRLVLEAGAVTAATLTVGDETARLQGRLVSAREVTLGGRLAGGDAIRLELRLDSEGRRAEGSWDAVVDGRQRKGAMTLTR